MKLNRNQIKEALEQTPIDKLLLGANSKDISLTHKQKAFAEEIAKGATKAQAYRKAYNSKGSPHTQSQEGQKLLKNPTISHHVETIKLAIESQKYLFPSHLRALVIQQLTDKALDPSVNHAQQIKALELIGKFSDVALFQERKEVKTDTNSTDAKAKLLDTLANAIRTSRTISDDKKRSAQELLEEITQGIKDKDEPITIDQVSEQLEQDNIDTTISNPSPLENGTTENPPYPETPEWVSMGDGNVHSIPHKQSPTIDNSPTEDMITETPPLSFTKSEWEGVDNFWEQFEDASTENTPLDDSGSPND